MTDLSGKNAIISGASRGLGAWIAGKFWSLGANLLLVSRNKQALQETVNRLEPRSGQKIVLLEADLAELANIDKIIDLAKKEFSGLDILINNAAVQGPIGPSWQNDWQDWQTALTIDLLAPVAFCRAAAAMMTAQKSGKIICISGGGATNARPNFSAYSVAKTGLVRFCEVLASELLPYNVQVNCIAPGAMPTDMLRQVVKAGPEAAGQKEFSSAETAMQNDNTVFEKASSLAAFLASSKSNGITGRLISAVWDPWESLADHADELASSDLYTLRRIVPIDRGLDWDQNEK